MKSLKGSYIVFVCLFLLCDIGGAIRVARDDVFSDPK